MKTHSFLFFNNYLFIFACAVSSCCTGLSRSSVGKESACNAGDLGSIPGSGRSPGEGNGNPLQDSCLEDPMGRGAWRATLHGVTRVGHDLTTKPPAAARGGYSLLQRVGSHCHGSPCRRAQLWDVSPSVVKVRGLSSRSPLEFSRAGSVVAVWAQSLCRMWDLPGPGVKSVSPALAGRFFTTEPSRHFL